MGKSYNIEVKLKDTRGDINKLIRRFIKKVKKERIIEDYLERSHYTKPSIKKRAKKLKRLENARKAEVERSKKIGKGRG